VPATRHSGKRPFPECQGQGTRGRGSLPRVLGLGTRGRAFPIFFKRFRLFAPSNATFLFRVPFFPECNSSPSATLGEDWVPDFWHSGKHVALGEYCFSRSERSYSTMVTRNTDYAFDREKSFMHIMKHPLNFVKYSWESVHDLYMP
jgi:hypothetical protein